MNRTGTSYNRHPPPGIPAKRGNRYKSLPGHYRAFREAPV